ncbi:hypothetical protein AB0L70_09305 [Kribbella sp. NPDC051952]|uniref:hypothetical protein n=1 Tax=Kribbella sp. NPDC051952 TaxID=3154851 RepID=UPI003416A5F7
MGTPNQAGDQPDIGITSPAIFTRFASTIENNGSAFRGTTGQARSAEPGTPGPLSGSPGLIGQLDQAGQLRAEYIDATNTGLQGYETVMTAVGAEHTKFGSATTGLMKAVETVRSSKDGGH